MRSATRTSKRGAAKTAPAPQERPVVVKVERPTHVPSEAFQAALLAEIRAMVGEVQAAHIAPDHILILDVDRCVKDALNALYRADKINVGQTLNSKWIKPTPTDAETE